MPQSLLLTGNTLCDASVAKPKASLPEHRDINPREDASVAEYLGTPLPKPCLNPQIQDYRVLVASVCWLENLSIVRRMFFRR